MRTPSMGPCAQMIECFGPEVPIEGHLKVKVLGAWASSTHITNLKRNIRIVSRFVAIS